MVHYMTCGWVLVREGAGCGVRMDREYTACRFVVMSLELARQAGQFDVTGVAALAVQGEDWAPQWRVHARVGPAPLRPSGAARRRPETQLRVSDPTDLGTAGALF